MELVKVCIPEIDPVPKSNDEEVDPKGVIVAYRSWYAETVDTTTDQETGRVSAQLRLKAVTHGTVWTPFKRMERGCKCSNMINCQCGSYAFQKISGLPQYVREISRGSISSGTTMMIGEVSLWGNVVIGEILRGEFGYPKCLYCPEEATIEYESLACRMAANYGVTVKYIPLKQLIKDVFNKEVV